MKSDTDLRRDVLDEIDWEPSIVDASQIGVTVKDGVVTLTGHIPLMSEKHAAEVVAKRVHGVRAVANDIEVRPPDSHLRDDAEIAAAALHALEWDAKVPHERVQVVVEDGWIKLEGTVDWQYQKAAVDRALRHLTGTRGVTNSIEIAPGEHALNVDMLSQSKGHVEAALLRSATLNSKRIRVEMEHGVVTLTGDVHSLAERDEAERMAWSARGVRRVENCITITPWGYGPAEEWGY